MANPEITVVKRPTPKARKGAAKTVNIYASLNRATPAQVVQRVREGIAPEYIRTISDALGITLKEMATLLGTAESTLHRILGAEASLPIADVNIAEKLVQLEALAKHGSEVFREPQHFLGWLRTAQWDLNDEKPLAYLNTTNGITVVDQLLGRIEYGISA